MLPLYHMFPINLLLSIIVIVGVIFYKFVYPKKNPNPLALLIIISILPIISVFREGVYESGDFALHIYRAIDFYNSLLEGHAFPSWAGNLNASFGYPLFIFINPLPYYLISFFHFVGFSFIGSMKLFLSLSFLASGIFMYLFSKELFKKNKAAFISSIFYQFAPYHLIDQHFRVTVGEITIYATLPLLLYASLLFIRKRNLQTFLFTSLCCAFLVLSHQAMAAFAVPIATIFMFFISFKNKKVFLLFLLALGLGLLSSFYALFPYLAYSKYVIAASYTHIIFLPFQDYILSPWQFGFLFQGPEGEIVTPIGIMHIFIFLATLLTIQKTQKYTKLFAFLTVVSIAFVLLLLPFSKQIWDKVPLIHLLIISSRLVLFLSLFLSLIAGIFSTRYTNMILLSLVTIVVVLSTSLNWGSRNLIRQNDTQLIQNVPQSTNMGEGWGIGIPKWKKPQEFEKKQASRSSELINGNGLLTQRVNKSTYKSFIVYATTATQLLSNTWFFPGWKAYINGRPAVIEKSIHLNEGRIVINIPKGLSKVELIYSDLPTHSFLKYFSAFFFTVSTLVIISRLVRQKRRN